METPQDIRLRAGADNPSKTQTDIDGVVELKRKIGLIGGINVIVGSIIGSGIFISPTGVLMYTGSINSAMIVWLSCGVFSMVGIYCYCELGLMIRKSGADYAYILTTFGPFFGFMRIWIEVLIIRPCTLAITALTFSIYAQKPFFLTCDTPDSSDRLLAICCLLLIAAINCWSVEWAAHVQNVFTFAKLFALLIVIVTGVYQLATGHVEHFTFGGSVLEVDKIALSFYSGLFAYNGWTYLNFLIEELVDPVRNLPIAAAVALLVVTFINILMNASYYSTISAEDVLGSEAVALTYAERIFGAWAWTIPVFVALSTFGSVNGILMTSSRLYYAGAMENQMPEVLTMLHIKRFTPPPAVMIAAILSIFYLFIDDVYILINYFGFANWLGIGASVLCIIVLRFTQPNLERPIKISLFWPIIYLVATIFITCVPIYRTPMETAIGVAVILSCVPVYLVFIKFKNKPGCMPAFTRFVQKFLIVVRPDEKLET